MADKPKPDKRGREKLWRPDNPIAYGLGISVLLIGAYLVLGFQSKCINSVCETNFQKFFEADPNEIGDTLAGLFAALAFVWIIVTVFLQSRELKEQRKEFREQRKATQDMARAMKAQAEIFEQEQMERQQNLSLRHADELLKSVRYELSHARLFWNFGADRRGYVSLFPWDSGATAKEVSNEEFIAGYVKAFQKFLDPIKTKIANEKTHSLSSQATLNKPIATTEKLLSVSQKLSAAERERFSRYELEQLFKQMKTYRNENIWSESVG